MKPGGGKQKGAQFERDICQALSLWVTRGERKDLFWRSAMSGGRATVMLKNDEKALTQAGDVSAIHPKGHKFIDMFYVECKFYKDLQFKNLLTVNGGNLVRFWEETKLDASAYSKQPFLVAKENRCPTLLVLNQEKSRTIKNNDLILAKIPSHDMVIWPFDEFISKVSV